MDIWAKLHFGERWCEDNGLQREITKCSQECMVTSTGRIDHKKYKVEFLKAMSEMYDKLLKTSDLIDKYGIS